MKKALASDFDNTLYFMDTEERFRAQDVFEILFFRKEGGVFGICECSQSNRRLIFLAAS